MSLRCLRLEANQMDGRSSIPILSFELFVPTVAWSGRSVWPLGMKWT